MMPQPGQPQPQQPQAPMPQGGAMPPQGGGSPMGAAAGGGGQVDPKQVQQGIMNVVAQTLTSEEQQMLAQALTPEMIQIVQKLFGQKASMFFIEPIQQVVGQGGAGNDAMEGDFMDTADQIGGTPGPMPTDEDMNGGYAPGMANSQPNPAFRKLAA